jgi:phosphoribosylaminoimidazole carboxylase PurE protein
MGSDSDWPMIQDAGKTLDRFGVPYEVRVISAHRTPDIAFDYAATARERGLKVIIAAAGGAAHLAGVLAAHTILPVIGIPVQGGALNGLDALLATVQMPAGIPVATVALGSAGSINAAILAVQILSTGMPEYAAKMVDHKKAIKEKVVGADAKLRAELKK